MAVWIPIFKASLPFLTQIVATAIPAFTAKPDASKADPIMAKQIEELQTAATHNAESVRVVAERLQQTIEGIDEVTVELQKQTSSLQAQVAGLKKLVVVTMLTAFVSLAFVLSILLN